MADIKISELTAALTVGDSDVLPMTASGSTVKVTTALLKEHAIGNTNISGIGDGSVTGAIDTLDDEDTTIKAMIAPTETSPTANSWTTGAQFIYNDVLYDVIADITEGDALTVGTNIAPADTVVEQIEDAVADIAQNASDISDLDANKMSYALNSELGAHNVLNVSATTQTVSGVTYSIDSKGIITINTNGTLAANSELRLKELEADDGMVGGKSYIFTINQGSDNPDKVGGYVDYRGAGNTGWEDGIMVDTPFNHIEGRHYGVWITVAAGANYSNLKIYPQITAVEDTDKSFAPYAMTNRELTEVKTFTPTVTSSQGTGTLTIKQRGTTAFAYLLFTPSSNINEGTDIQFSISGSFPIPLDLGNVTGYAGTAAIVGFISNNKIQVRTVNSSLAAGSSCAVYGTYIVK